MAQVSASISLADRVEIAERGVVEPGQHRLDAGVVLRLGRRGERAHRPAVEAVRCMVMILYRPFGLPLSRASLIAASFASVPLLQKKHWPPKSVRSLSACGEQRLRLGVPGVRDVDERGRPAPARPRRPAAGSGRGGRSPSRGRSRGSGSPRRPRPTSPRRGPGRPGSGCSSPITYFLARAMICSAESGVGGHWRHGYIGQWWPQARTASDVTGTISVPADVSPRNSSSSEYGYAAVRMTCGLRPGSSASKHASTFGTMPPSMTPRRDQLAGTRPGQARDERARVGAVAEDAGRVGEEDQLVGLQRARRRRRPRCRRSRSASRRPSSDRERRDHRDDAGSAQKSPEAVGVDARHLPDAAQVDRSPSVLRQKQSFAERGSWTARCAGRRRAAEFAKLPNDAGVDLVLSTRTTIVQRGVVGVAAALDLPRRQGPAAAIARSIGLPPPWTRTSRTPSVSG